MIPPFWRLILLFGVVHLMLLLLTGCQTETGLRAPSWRDLTPGQSIEAEVVSRLGKPAAQYPVGAFTVYSYPSDTGGLSIPNKIALQNGIVKIIMVHVIDSTDTLAVRVQRYGEPEKITWPPPTACITRLFVFAHQGRAVEAENLISPSNATVFGEWYFEPMSLDRFSKEIAPAFVPLSSYCGNDHYPESYWVNEK